MNDDLLSDERLDAALQRTREMKVLDPLLDDVAIVAALEELRNRRWFDKHGEALAASIKRPEGPPLSDELLNEEIRHARHAYNDRVWAALVELRERRQAEEEMHRREAGDPGEWQPVRYTTPRTKVAVWLGLSEDATMVDIDAEIGRLRATADEAIRILRESWDISNGATIYLGHLPRWEKERDAFLALHPEEAADG